MFEIELKFAVADVADLRERLGKCDAVFVSKCENRDTYFNHPSRDFAQSGEALRIRREDDVPMITYKGVKRPGPVKAREELEWRLDPGDPKGQSTETLLDRLGFRRVATVCKWRETFRVGDADHPMTITIDEVENLGTFAEIERILHDAEPRDDAIETARGEVTALASQLGLQDPEPRSYLRMQLESSGG